MAIGGSKIGELKKKLYKIDSSSPCMQNKCKNGPRLVADRNLELAFVLFFLIRVGQSNQRAILDFLGRDGQLDLWGT